jgi:translation initiation factor 4G
MYAKLCKRLADEIKIPLKDDEGKPVTFKRLLLNRCQEEFQQNQWKANKKIPREGLTEAELQKLDLHQDKARVRFIGNIVFVGELHKESMLIDKIMHGCIQKLLADDKNPSPEDMEALCKLLSTSGKILDTPPAAHYFNVYFDRINTVVK